MGNWVVIASILLIASDAFSRPYEGNPFGMIGADVHNPAYLDPPYYDAEQVGVHWNRSGSLYAYLWLIDANINSPPNYTWASLDDGVRAVPATIQPLGNIVPYNEFNYSRMVANTYLPKDEQRYRDFVRAVVERYDGDGVSDMPNLQRPIKYWQVANEPDNTLRSNFADLQRMSYEEIKDADPFAKVIIGGATAGGPTFTQGWIAAYNQRFVPILNALGGHYADIMDVHWYGATDSDYRMRDGTSSVLAHVRATMNSAGFSPSLPIWITELGAVSGWPVPPAIARTETDMARDVLKKISYIGSLGVQKLFANKMMEGFFNTDGYFDHSGYLYDGVGAYDNPANFGVPKLAYFSYKLMSEKFSDADWSSLVRLRDGTGTDKLYLLKVMRAGVPVWVAWWDYFDDPTYVPGAHRTLQITGVPSSLVRATEAIPNVGAGSQVGAYATAFTSVTRSVIGGTTSVVLGEVPVIVEASTRSACGNGVVEAGEGCDDGNADDDDGCGNDCHATLCRGGAKLENVLLEVKGIGMPVGSQVLSVQGRIVFPPGAQVDLDLTDLGAQVYVAGRGLQTVQLLDLSTSTKTIPPGSSGSGCDRIADGWRSSGSRVVYRNRSGAIDPPACSVGSARGLKLLSFADRRSLQGAIKFKLQAKGISVAGDRSTSTIDDAVRVTVVLGRSAAAGNAGKCATIDLSNCSRFLSLKCKAG